MKVIQEIKQMVFTHKAWPYPRSHEQLRHVITLSLVIILITLVCIIAGLKYEEQKSLGRSDVRLSAQDMTSYTAQLLLLAEKSQQQSLMQPYREVYLQQLSDDISTIHAKLSQHQINRDVSREVHHLTLVSEQTTGILAALIRQSDDGTFRRYLPQLKALADQSKQIEASL